MKLYFSIVSTAVLLGSGSLSLAGSVEMTSGTFLEDTRHSIDFPTYQSIIVDPGNPGYEFRPVVPQPITEPTPLLTRVPDLIFSETFEDDGVSERWQLDSDNEGRIEVVDFEGAKWLQMDDSVDNGVFSQNIATHTVDISGLSRLRLDFEFFRAQDEWHGTPTEMTDYDGIRVVSAYDEYAYDGVILRSGTGDSARTAYLPTTRFSEGHNFFYLDSFLLLEDETLEIGLFQYDNLSAPNDGLLWGDIQLTGFEHREIHLDPDYEISESETTLAVTVVIDPVPEEDVVLSLNRSSYSSPFNREAPWIDPGLEFIDFAESMAVYPAGTGIAHLEFSVDYENELLEGDRFETLYVTDGAYASYEFILTIQDNEPAALELEAPAAIKEGESATTTLFSRNLENDYQSIDVRLESSAPALLAVPASVRVRRDWSPAPGGGGSATIDIQPVYNPELTGDQTVTLTASFGEESVSQEITIQDRNSLLPQIQLVSGSLAEGGEAATFEVFFDARVNETVTVALQSSDPQAVLSTSSLIFNPGTERGEFSISITDDELAQGNREFTIQAEAVFASSVDPYTNETNLTILDDETAGFSGTIPDMLERGAAFDLQLMARSADGDLVSGYNETVTIYLEDRDAASRIELASGLQFVDGELSASIFVPSDASGSSLVLEDSDGSQFRLSEVILFGAIDFAVTSLTYDTDREQFYAVSGGAALPGHLHSVTPINPQTLEIGTGIFIGNDPTVSTLTFDNSFLYVGQRGAHQISRLNLDTLNVDQTITLTSTQGSWSNYSYFPMQILTLPSDPLRIVVSQDATSSSYENVVAYQNGTSLPDHLSHDSLSMVNGSIPNVFYGLYGATLRKYQSNGTGFTLIEESRNLLDGSSSMHIHGEGDWVVSNAGHVIDGEKMEKVAQIELAWKNTSGSWNSNADEVETDLARSRLYFAKGQELLIYEAQGYTLIQRLQIPCLGDVTALIRYGETGLAIATDEAEVLFIESPMLVPTGEPVDLKVSLVASPIPAQLGETVTFSGTIENVSTEQARAVNLVLTFNRGINISGATADQSGTTRKIIPLGDLAAGETHEFSFEGTPTALATLVASATATTQSLDLNYADNRATVIFNAGFESTANSVNVLELEFNQAIYDPVNEWIVATTQDSAHQGVANMVLAIDPMTGLIERSLSLPEEGDLVRLSEDGSVLYVVNTRGSTAYRIDWLNLTVTQTISFGDIGVDDFEILRGANDSIAVGSDDGGVTIFKDGVALENSSGWRDGNLVELLPDPSLLFSFNSRNTGFQSFKFELNESGVQTLIERGGLLDGFNKQIKADGYFIYDNRGSIVRADLMTVSGTFDLAAMGSSGATAVEPERDLQRVYFSKNKSIASYDSDSLLLIRKQELPSLPGNLETLERWGEDGFASILSIGYLALIRTDLIPTEPGPIDLNVAIKDGATVDSPTLMVSGSAFTGQGIQSVTVNGAMSSTVDAFASWFATIELDHGQNSIEVTATPAGTGAAKTRVYSINYVDPARTEEHAIASLWMEGRTGHASSARDLRVGDWDQDGISDLAEFLFGTDPAIKDRASPQIKATTANGLVVSFIHREHSTYTYQVKVSSDLVEWADAGTSLVPLGDPEPITERPGYARSRFSMEPNSNTQMFVSVTVDEME